MPRLSWRNWKRLALIPAGGDWRDLEGVLAGRARREVFRRHPVADWSAPSDAITGPGGHAVEAVGDPRIEVDEDGLSVRGANGGVYGVHGWDTQSGTVTGGSDNPSRGAFSVADVRVGTAQGGAYGVKGWDEPAATVTGEVCPSNGPASVADPRTDDLAHGKPGAFHNIDRVLGWDETPGTVTSSRAPSSGRPVVADPRIDDPDFMPRGAYDAGWGVLGWEHTARTIAGQVAPGQGAYAVAERRSPAPAVRRMTLDEALALKLDPNKPPPFVPMIIAEDGTWHRPLTLLELAVLQSYPVLMYGKPIVFGGTRTQIAEHIGNSVPPDAAQPIGTQMLTVLLHADAESWALSGGGPVWVGPVSDRSDTLGAS
jgi:site-specific DNA-cytosine methylase